MVPSSCINDQDISTSYFVGRLRAIGFHMLPSEVGSAEYLLSKCQGGRQLGGRRILPIGLQLVNLDFRALSHFRA